MCRPHCSIYDPLKRKNLLKLWCLTMIYPATGWFEMAQIPNKTAAEIADITEKNWFTRYPLPQQIVFDCGTEFMAEFSKMCHNEYGLKRKPITTRNPQSNAIIKRIHQNIGNIIRTFDVSNLSTTIHGQASLPQPCLPSAQLITQRYKHPRCS